MANRRMFHAAVVESDAFLAMPPKAQALYFHLGMHCDNHGFTNRARQLAKRGFGGDKILNLLKERGFLFVFSDVILLRHFRLANCLKSDRENTLQYPDLAREIYITRDKCYTLNPEDGEMSLWEYQGNILEKKRKKLDSKKFPKEEKEKENKIKEEKINEEKESADAVGGDGARPLNRMNGQLGQGVILLNNWEQERLLDLLGLDGFDHYVKKLSDFILANDAQVNNHYSTIIRWAKQDRRISDDCE